MNQADSYAAEVICLGMAVADVLVRGFHVPRPGTTEFVEAVQISGGGDAFNQAVALGHLGHKVALATRVGADGPGDLVRSIAAAAGVDTSFTTITPDVATITSIALVDESAERSFLTQRSLATEFSASPALRAGIAGGPRAVSVGSLCWSDGLDLHVLPEILPLARAAGSFTIADFTTDRDVPLESLRPILQHLDCVVPSLAEAAHLTGTENLDEIASAFRACGARDVIIKLGADGSVGYFGDKVIRVPALAIYPVDTTGAGDNFTAGFISGVLRGWDPYTAMRYGTATGAIATLTVGGSGALESRALVEEFLRSHDA